MTYKRILVSVLSILTMSSCSASDPSVDTGGRELRPPRSGINVGALYFVREKPTEDLSTPANLERLCDVNLARYNVEPLSQQVTDIDLLNKIEGDKSFSIVKTAMLEAGISGAISEYYEYKLTNVTQIDISRQQAEEIFQARAFREDCLRWRSEISKPRWAQYQILSIKVGDITFRRKSSPTDDFNLAVKLAKIEPLLKASIKKSSQATFSGKGVVAVFSPLLRNPSK